MPLLKSILNPIAEAVHELVYYAWAFSPEPFFADNVIDAMSSCIHVASDMGCLGHVVTGFRFRWEISCREKTLSILSISNFEHKTPATVKKHLL